MNKRSSNVKVSHIARSITVSGVILLGLMGCQSLSKSDTEASTDSVMNRSTAVTTTSNDKIVNVQSNDGYPATVSQTPNASQIEACRAKNGDYRKVGMLQSYQCVIQYTDAGDTCQDAADCEGACYGSGRLPVGVAGQVGQCARDSDFFGCSQPVVKGIASPTICID